MSNEATSCIKSCVELAKKRIPLWKRLSQGYSLHDVSSDVLAGFTVGLSVIPQSIAFAIIAELPSQYGLYSAFMSCFVYALLGSVSSVTLGPTTLMALMTRELATIHVGYAPLLALCNGLIILALGIFQLGFLMGFVSSPVVSSFSSAASVTIIMNQLKNILGIQIEKKSGLPGILKSLEELIINIHSFRWPDFLLGLASFFLLISLQKLAASKCVNGGRLSGFRQRWLKTCLWLLSISRNAITVLMGGTLAFFLSPDKAANPFILTGDIKTGLPPFSLPPFGINATKTVVDPSIGDILGELGSVLATLPLVTILSQVAISKTFAKGQHVDATQELLALGSANIMGSFFLSMPVAASFGRSAVNAASGVKTTLGGLITGSLVLLALQFLMPFCAYIPRTSLAAIILCAVVPTIEFGILIRIWKSKKVDLIVVAVTLASCLLWSLEYGIMLGIAVNLTYILYDSSRPGLSSQLVQQVNEDNGYSSALLIQLRHGWFYPASGYLSNRIKEVICDQSGNSAFQTVILDLSMVHHLDFTSVTALLDLIQDLGQSGHHVMLRDLSASLRGVLDSANLSMSNAASLNYIDEPQTTVTMPLLPDTYQTSPQAVIDVNSTEE